MSKISKFRAFWEYNHQVAEVVEINYKGNWVCDEPYVVVDGRCDLIPLRKCIIMQSTGLKDKNGVEIFESDIVKVMDGDSEEDSYTSAVKNYAEEGYPAFDIEFPSAWYYESNVLSTIVSGPYETIEVIGNVRENPDLLEEE